MRYPVIIAAHREKDVIARTLRNLDPATTEPRVIVNGEDDGTVDIARKFAESHGVRVSVREEQGKLPAIQYGLWLLGRRATQESVLLIDADGYPAHRKAWAPAMGRALLTEGSQPAVVSGLLGVHGGVPLISRKRTEQLTRKAEQAAAHGDLSAVFGANMGVKLDDVTLEAVLAMPHQWPGEDRAMAKLIIDYGGQFIQSLDEETRMMTDDRGYGSIVDRVRYGREGMLERSGQNYLQRAAPGSQPAPPMHFQR